MKNVRTLFALALVTMSLSLASHAQPVPEGAFSRVLKDDLSSPWAVTTSPDKHIWITEKGGSVRILDAQYKELAKLTTFPDLVSSGQGGLLDIAFHPHYAKTKWVYFSYVVNQSSGLGTRVTRFTFSNGALTEPTVMINGPTGSDTAHFGSRLVFDQHGYLYATFGDRHQKELAQDLTTLHGKTVRLNDDGTIPADNPFGASNPIFTYGHRNPQGLGINPLDGALYVSEHGPSGYDAPGGGDEINKLEAGMNYGWPVIHHTLTRQGMITPLREYTPSIAPSGMEFYSGDVIAEWKNDLFIGTLAGSMLLRLSINEQGQVVEEQVLLDGTYGRLRDVGTAPDGSLLIVTDNGQLVQISKR